MILIFLTLFFHSSYAFIWESNFNAALSNLKLTKSTAEDKLVSILLRCLFCSVFSGVFQKLLNGTTWTMRSCMTECDLLNGCFFIQFSEHSCELLDYKNDVYYYDFEYDPKFKLMHKLTVNRNPAIQYTGNPYSLLDLIF